MADDQAQEKQHQPTSKHIMDLRKRGVVMRSRDLSGGMIFFVTITLLIFMSSELLSIIKENFVITFSSIPSVLHDHNYLIFVLKKIALKTFNQLLPMFIVILIVAILSPFVFGGWNFTLDAIQFKLSKLNPTENLARLFSYKKTLMEVGRSIVKASVFLGFLAFFLYANKNDIINLGNMPVMSAIYTSAFTLKTFIVFMCSSLVITVLFDMAYHYFQYQQKAKMSMQQIKDEHKETEGSVESKRKMRMKQLALMKQRISLAVPKADIVITNPTHYAVALKYNKDKDKAPRLVAKGKGLLAQQIRQVAVANAITIYQAPELSRAIYFTTKLGSEIHPGLYKAVAIVLTYAYQLKNYQHGLSDHPEYITDLQIPDEFIYHE